MDPEVAFMVLTALRAEYPRPQDYARALDEFVAVAGDVVGKRGSKALERRTDKRGRPYCFEKGRGRVPCPPKVEATPLKSETPQKVEEQPEQRRTPEPERAPVDRNTPAGAVIGAILDHAQSAPAAISDDTFERAKQEYRALVAEIPTDQWDAIPEDDERWRKRVQLASGLSDMIDAREAHGAKAREVFSAGMRQAMQKASKTPATFKPAFGAPTPFDFIAVHPVRPQAVDSEQQKAVGEAVDFLQSIVANDKPISARFIKARGRAETHVSIVGSIMISLPDARPEAVIHEVAHAIEKRKPGVLKAAKKFLEKRCGDEQPVDLTTLPGGQEMVGEYGRKDHFDRAFDGVSAYYVGKTYMDGSNIPYAGYFVDSARSVAGAVDATEVVSMGLEKLYTDPIGFARADPEYVQFLIDEVLLS